MTRSLFKHIAEHPLCYNEKKGRRSLHCFGRKLSVAFVSRPLSLASTKIKSGGQNVHQNRNGYIARQWSTFTGRFFCWPIWPSVVHWLSQPTFQPPTNLTIDVIDTASPHKSRSLIRLMSKPIQNRLPLYQYETYAVLYDNTWSIVDADMTSQLLLRCFLQHRHFSVRN